jgi:autophagy-related protein 17
MASPTDSLQSEPSALTQVPLDTLVSHLLASKRSLSSVTHVYRANELVTSTRKSLETTIITSARTEFLRSGIDSQVRILDRVRKNTEGVANESAAEFAAVIQTLDVADERLRKTLDLLRGTMVEATLRPPEEEKKSLMDFVDETGMAGLMENIEGSINAANGAHAEFRDTNAGFDEDVKTIKELLTKKKPLEISDSAGEHAILPVHEILHDMEDHAKDMADNLESLVTHFDLCVTAIKHTEGGGDAAQRLADDLPGGMDLGQAATSGPTDPIGEDERLEMLEVLQKDASQVEDVVTEIKDHIAEMETQHELVTAHVKRLTEEHDNTISAFKLLENIGSTLPGFITQSHLFVMRWDDEKSKIEERMAELESLRFFYEGFLGAYDNLLIEIGRRKVLEQKMEKVAQDATARMQKLYEEDEEERDVFRKEQGEFLPRDIWPGLTAEPLKYEILPIGGGERGKVPEISKSVVQQAIRRVNARG